jgi:hypothetical protein
MEHRSDADMGPEVLRIGRDREKGVGRCSKQDAIDDRLVLISDIGNLLWQRKYHMEIRDRKQIGFTCGKPFPRRCALALRAVSITAGNGELTISCLMGKFRNGELTAGFIELSVNFRDFTLHYGLPPSDPLSACPGSNGRSRRRGGALTSTSRGSRRPLWRMQIQRRQDFLHPIRGDAFRLCQVVNCTISRFAGLGRQPL